MLYNLCSFVYLCTVIVVHIDCLENPLKMYLIRYQYATISGEKRVCYKTRINTFNKYILSMKNEL